MITQFAADTALLLIDVQKGVNDFDHWGGANGRRNNAQAEDRMRELLAAWREAGWPVVYTRHDSREPDSPLKLSLPSGAMIDGFEDHPGEVVIEKDVNSAFIGTPLEIKLREMGCHRLVVAGFFTNFCVETSVRMAGNMGYDTYLAHDACATTNRVLADGTDVDPEMVHAMSVANMHGEFCTALSTEALLGLVKADAIGLDRAQGNEATAPKPSLRIAG